MLIGFFSQHGIRVSPSILGIDTDTK